MCWSKLSWPPRCLERGAPETLCEAQSFPNWESPSWAQLISARRARRLGNILSATGNTNEYTGIRGVCVGGRQYCVEEAPMLL